MYTAPAALVPRLARAVGRVKRTSRATPIIRDWLNARHRTKVIQHAISLPRLSDWGAEILDELSGAKAVLRDVEPLMSGDVLELVDWFVSRLAASGSPKRSIRIAPDDIAAEPALFKWGLSDEILNLAENYIGLPVHYRGVDIKREVADGRNRDVRQWHIDVDDRRMLKVIVYLNDVDGAGGPFEFIDCRSTTHAVDILKYSSGFVPDRRMREVVPEASWQSTPGPRLSAIFVDTSRVFHRVRPPTSQDRYSMTFSYSSENPFQVFPEFSLKRSTLRKLRPELSARQWRASRLV